MREHCDGTDSRNQAIQEQRRARLDSSSDTLRPYLQEIFDMQDLAVSAITKRSRLRFRLDRLSPQNEAGLTDGQETRRPDDLDRLTDELAIAEDKVAQAKAEAIRAEEAYQDQLIEERVEGVPLGSREAARALLLEERRAIRTALDAAPVSAGELGSAAGTVFGIQRRLREARSRGDEEAIAHLQSGLAAAEIRLAHFRTLMEEVYGRIREIRADCSEHLKRLSED